MKDTDNLLPLASYSVITVDLSPLQNGQKSQPDPFLVPSYISVSSVPLNRIHGAVVRQWNKFTFTFTLYFVDRRKRKIMR